MEIALLACQTISHSLGRLAAYPVPLCLTGVVSKEFLQKIRRPRPLAVAMKTLQGNAHGDRRRCRPTPGICQLATARADHPPARRRALAGDLPDAADGDPARAVHRPSVRQRHPALGHRYQGRSARPLRRPRQFRQDLERRHLPGRGVQHLPLHVRHDGFQTSARVVAGLAAQPAFPRQGVHARLYPFAIHHPDRAVDLCLEMDVRPDLQRPQLDAVPSRDHQDPHQLAGRPDTWRWSR